MAKKALSEIRKRRVSLAERFRGLVACGRRLLNIDRNPSSAELNRANQLPSRILNLSPGAEISILTPKHTCFVAALIQHSLSVLNVKTTIIHEKPMAGFSDQTYIVIAPQMFVELPVRYIAYQMEQSVSQRWFDERYLSILEKSAAVFDYSIENIKFLEASGLSVAKIYYMPLSIRPDMDRPAPGHLDGPEVLFYGDPHVERRSRILQYLKRHFKVDVVSEVYGPELYKKIMNAKIIVNIHYYEDALLETTRIYECLSLGKLIVSERGSNQSENQGLENLVEFVDVGDVEQLVSTISKLLNRTDYFNKRMSDIEVASRHTSTEFKYYFLRFLLASDEINFEQFYALASSCVEIKSTKICLGLPEYPERQEKFRSSSPPEFQMFPGLRHRIGWVGCGLSYKFIMRKAMELNAYRIVICEDDVEFLSSSVAKMDKTLQYLSDLEDWDIFSGLIADLHEGAQIQKVVPLGDLKLIYLNKIVSMVYNVYNRNIFESFLEWDPDFLDLEKNTIDRFLENQPGLRIVTSQPFLVGHREDLQSTIWGFGNAQYNRMIAESVRRLGAKIASFESEHQ